MRIHRQYTEAQKEVHAEWLDVITFFGIFFSALAGAILI